MSDLTKQSELKELADHIEAEKIGWLPTIGSVVNFTMTLSERDTVLAALRSSSSAGAREALESIDAILDAVWSTNDRAEEVDGLVKIKAIIRSALSDHGVQESAAGANTKSDGGVEGHATASEGASYPKDQANQLASTSSYGTTGEDAPAGPRSGSGIEAAGIKPGPSDAKLAIAVSALEFVRDGYGDQDVNHVDYRVRVYEVALDALAQLTKTPSADHDAGNLRGLAEPTTRDSSESTTGGAAPDHTTMEERG